MRSLFPLPPFPIMANISRPGASAPPCAEVSPVTFATGQCVHSTLAPDHQLSGAGAPPRFSAPCPCQKAPLLAQQEGLNTCSQGSIFNLTCMIDWHATRLNLLLVWGLLRRSMSLDIARTLAKVVIGRWPGLLILWSIGDGLRRSRNWSPGS